MGPPRSTSTVATALRQDVAAVARQLLRRGETLALAESCTGGLLAAALTAAPGSSAFFLGAVVCYSNASKRQLLGVSPASLRRYGAVSAPVASALASGARLRFGADWSLAITGIAGPSGGSASKPVGTVCVAMAGPLGRPRVSIHHFTGNRSQIRRQSVRAALALLSKATRSQSQRPGAV